MIRFLLLVFFIVIILYVLKNKSKKNLKSDVYKKLIFIVIILGVVFLLATSGRFILPQILQIIKFGIPFLTKFIGL